MTHRIIRGLYAITGATFCGGLVAVYYQLAVAFGLITGFVVGVAGVWCVEFRK